MSNPRHRFGREQAGLLLGPLVFAAILLAPLGDIPEAAQRMMAVAALMAIFWVSEAIPLAATSLIPLAVYPLLDLGSAAEASAPYANHLVFLFLGGFMLAQAMQRWGLHRRIALEIVHRIGTSPRSLVLGFMCASGFLSMWVSNTATVAMMMPIGLAVVQQAVAAVKADPEMSATVDVRPGRFHFGVDLMLGIAYGSSIGGLATLIGTPPNVFLAGAMAQTEKITISFITWLGFAFPLAAVFLPLTWLWLTRVAFPIEIPTIPGGAERIEEERRKLGPMTSQEKRLATVFALTAAAWTFAPLWTSLFPTGRNVTDSTIGMIATIFLFVLPAGNGDRLLDWPWASKLPWDVLLLFGGGFSLASGFERSGLSAWVASRLTAFEDAPLFVFIVIVVILIVVLTEFASNTASAAMSIPLLAATAHTLGVSPLLLAIPATVAASCAFMLPAATPPNAIVFGTGYFTIPQLAKAGFGVNLIGVVLVSLFTWFLARPLFGI